MDRDKEQWSRAAGTQCERCSEKREPVHKVHKKTKKQNKTHNSMAGLANYVFFILYAYETTLQEQETRIGLLFSSKC